MPKQLFAQFYMLLFYLLSKDYIVCMLFVVSVRHIPLFVCSFCWFLCPSSILSLCMRARKGRGVLGGGGWMSVCICGVRVVCSAHLELNVSVWIIFRSFSNT